MWNFPRNGVGDIKSTFAQLNDTFRQISISFIGISIEDDLKCHPHIFVTI